MPPFWAPTRGRTTFRCRRSKCEWCAPGAGWSAPTRGRMGGSMRRMGRRGRSSALMKVHFGFALVAISVWGALARDLPDSFFTPGEADNSLTMEVLCTPGFSPSKLRNVRNRTATGYLQGVRYATADTAVPVRGRSPDPARHRRLEPPAQSMAAARVNAAMELQNEGPA